MPNSFLHGNRCPYCFGSLKKTTEQFKQEVYDLVGNEYTVVGDYKTSATKLTMHHNVCGKDYEVVPNNFLKGSRCSYCAVNKKRTTEQLKQEVYDLVGDEYTVVGDYKTRTAKITMHHQVCGKDYEVTPSNFLSGRRCPYCSRKILKTTEEFKKKIFDLVGNEYEVLGEYENVSTKILMYHNKCNRNYNAMPESFLSGSRCPYCVPNAKKTAEQFKQEAFALVGDEYVNSTTKIHLLHKICCKSYEVTPNSFLSGNRCPYCAGNMKKTTEQYKQEVKNLEGNRYIVLGEYVNGQTKILMKHVMCGEMYETKPATFLSGHRCPYCAGKRKSRFNEHYYDHLLEHDKKKK